MLLLFILQTTLFILFIFKQNDNPRAMGRHRLHLYFPILYDRTLTKGSLVNKIRGGVKFPVCLESVAQAAWRAGFLYREDWVRSALVTRC